MGLSIFFVPFEVLDNVAVGEYVLEGVVVHGTYELDPVWIVFQFAFVVVDGADNTGAKALSVFLGLRKKCAPDKFAGVNDLQLCLWDSGISPIFNRFNDEGSVNLPIA
jgi:hypothetical protein